MPHLNLPNLLTGLRVVCIFPVYWLLDHQYEAAGLTLLIFSLLLDFFDGKLARKLGQSTPFGAVFDPVADKTVIISYFVIISYQTQLLPIWFVGLVFIRNFSQLSVIPVLSWWLRISFLVKPKFLPKLATAISFALVILGMWALPHKEMLHMPLVQWTFNILVGLSTLLEIYVLVTFVPRYWQIARGLHDTFE